MLITAQIKIPEKLEPVLTPPRGHVLPNGKPVRYRAMYGGRGGAKSRTAAGVAALWGSAEKLRVLCVREYQSSIRDSFHAELKAAIEADEFLSTRYEVGVDYITEKITGTVFLFKGLRHNIAGIKSTAGIDLTICEEAEDYSEDGWLALEATVFRQPKSEIWALWNRRRKGSATDKRFIVSPPDNALITEINWRDNPFFPDAMKDLRRREKARLDPGVYEHIWEGAYATAFEGAYYAASLREARTSGRISRVARDPLLEVRAYFDIGGTGGSADATAIWLVQFVGKEVRWLDYYEASGQPLEMHVNWIRSHSYPIKTCVLPHDGVQHDKVYAVTYEGALRSAGFTVITVPNQGRGAALRRIEALRRLMPSCWFDLATERGLEVLGWYHEKKNEQGYGMGPEHDWSSHGADAAGLVAVHHAMAGPKANVPKFEPIKVI
jgi:phage terminase large subunit